MKGEVTAWCALLVVVWKSGGSNKYYFGDLGKAITFVDWLSEPNQKEDVLDLRLYNDVWERLWIGNDG